MNAIDAVKGKGWGLTIFSRYPALWAFVVFICLSAYALGANPFSSETVAPLDILAAAPGWVAGQSVHKIVHWESTDIIDSQLPTWIPLKAQIRAGQGSLWYPYGTGGQPVVFELFNPIFLLFLMVRDNALAYYLAGLAKLVISGFGTYLLLKIFLRWLPSLWGGMVFMLCGFNAAWFFWEHVSTSMWIPWLLWATVTYLKTDELKWLPAITLISLLLIAGGFPAVAAFGFYSFAILILLWNLYGFYAAKKQAAHKSDKKLTSLVITTGFPLLAVGMAFLMAAIIIIPFLDSMAEINLGYRSGGGTPFSIHDLRLFFSYENPPRIERTAYVGSAVLMFALAGVVAAFQARDNVLKLFVVFNFLLVLAGTLVTFGLLPNQVIRAIPVFNNNSWGRLIVIPLLGLSALSAVGLDFFIDPLATFIGRSLKIEPLHSQRIVIMMVILLLVLQFYSQKKLFNSFNAVVPSSWLYPSTPSIAHVKEHLQPLQSVIADDSFAMSGTLGAYGIAQWYAHTFRTDREKEVLGSLVHDPFPSPTSALIKGGNIQFNSSLMEKLAVKYLLVTKRVLYPDVEYQLPGTPFSLAPPLPGSSWKQHLYISNDMVVGHIGFLFATYGEEHSPANVLLSLYKDDDNKLIAESELDKNEIKGNGEVYFRFPDKIALRKGNYSLVLRMVDYAGPDKLSAWVIKNQGNKGDYLEINGRKYDVSLKCGIVAYEKMDLNFFAKKWNIIDLEQNVMIFENKQVTNSAYFTDNLDPSGDRIDFSGLVVRQPSSDLIEIEYAGRHAGWIVLPMHLNAGWKAIVDNREVTYDTYLGILPAIPVQGATHIKFSYRPASFWKGTVVSLIGLVIFLIFSGACLKKDRQVLKEKGI